MTPEALYAAAPVEHHPVGDTNVALRRFGSGPALLLIHGFPVHGYTWRGLLPALAERRTCFVVDLPGFGDSDWRPSARFRFGDQARRLAALLAALRIERCALLAHDTGATVARLLALAEPNRIERLALVNTEIPGHRPPWIPLYCHLAALPGAAAAFRLLLARRWFVRSPMGLGAFYSDRRLLDHPTRLGPYLDPLLSSPRRMAGVLRFLRDAEWEVVDDLRSGHARIAAPVLLLWGEDDRTFPVEQAERMAGQFTGPGGTGGPASFVRIPHASLMPHEERPDAVLAALLPFLEGP